MRRIDQIIVHCSATPPSMDIGVEEIRQWHVRDNKWQDIGYHWVIRRGGVIEKGRDESRIGAHVAGHNSHSIGVCLVGGRDRFDFTLPQIHSLHYLADQLRQRYPNATFHGHNEFSNKRCPQFDVQEFFR